MKTARKSRKVSFKGVPAGKLRPHQYMARGEAVPGVKNPGSHGSRKSGKVKRG